MNRRETFNSVIFDYDYARPLYPKKLFDDIVAYSNLKVNAKILEVGAGTGQATSYFSNNYHLTALEIGVEQVDFLKKKFPQIHIECVPFENYITEKESFDLIFSATAFHWIEAEIGYPKAYELLKNQGTMAVFWHTSSVTRFDNFMHNGIREICCQYSPSLYEGLTSDELNRIHKKRLSQITIGGLFKNPDYSEYVWTDYYDAEKYIALLNTFSSFQMIATETRKMILDKIYQFIESNDDMVEVPQKVKLYMVKK